MTIALDALFFFAGWAHVLLAPYTKVEESFNLHATHDVLMYGPNDLHNYDHFTFPGAVPRTFVGSLLLAWLSTPAIQLIGQMAHTSLKSDLQIILRLVLASFNALGLCLIRRATARRYGQITSLFFTLFSITQFHLPFWMGRTLPNMFALFPVNLAISLLIDQSPNKISNGAATAIALLTFTAVVIRAEVALLLAPITLQAIFHNYITFSKALKVGLVSGLLSLTITMAVDSYFWQIPYNWPEFVGIYFNVVLGKSADWGISPPFAYWHSHLPKLLLSAFPLSIIGFFREQATRTLLLPYLIFISLISLLAHKEWRFIIYVVPVFNIAAARTARRMLSQRNGTVILTLLILLSLVALNIAVTGILTVTSMNNYPGGQALALIHELYPPYSPAHFHISNFAAQTGASLFLQLNAPPFPPRSYLPNAQPLVADLWWTYNKTENLTIQDLTASSSITHLIAETQPDRRTEEDWYVVASVKAFERWVFDRAALQGLLHEQTLEQLGRVLRMIKVEQLWILQRKL